MAREKKPVMTVLVKFTQRYNKIYLIIKGLNI